MPQPTPSLSPKTALVVAAVASLVVGGALGASLGGKKQYELGYKRGFEAAKEKVKAAGVLPPEFPIYTLSGTVTEVGSDYLIMDAPQTVRDPLGEPAPTKRTVRVTADTKIVQLSQKPTEEFQKELNEFNAAQQKFIQALGKGATDVSLPTPPDPLTRKDAQLADVTVGSSVTVTSASDILRLESFDATQIHVNPAGFGGVGGVGGFVPGGFAPTVPPATGLTPVAPPPVGGLAPAVPPGATFEPIVPPPPAQ